MASLGCTLIAWNWLLAETHGRQVLFDDLKSITLTEELRAQLRDIERDLSSGKARLALIGGSVISALLFLVAWYSASTRQRAQEMAHGLTSARARIEARLHGIIDTAMDAIITVNQNQIITIFNPAAEAIFGYRANDVIGTSLDRLIPPVHRVRHRDHIAHFGETGVTSRSMGADLTITGLRANGEIFPIDASISRLAEGSDLYYTVILRDITRRKQAEDALKLSLRFNEEVMDSIDEGLIVYDADVRVVAWNRFMEDFTGLKRKDAIGRHIFEVFPTLTAYGIETELQRALAGQRVISDSVQARLRGTTEYLPPDADPQACMDPRLAWTLSSFAPHRDQHGRVVGVITVIVDVTEITRIQNDLKTTNDRLRQLSSHLESAREAERMRIAREIHDELAATLSGIKMDLSAAGESMKQDPERLATRLRASLGLLDGAVQTTRRIINDLRPSILDNLGVWAAIEWLASDTAHRAGIRCEAHVDPVLETMQISTLASTVLFRVVQEALSNVRRHAQATIATVHCECAQGTLRVEVLDNGQGVDWARARQSGHWGLLGMEERVRSLGGSIEISKNVPQGTRIIVRIPIQP